LARAQPQRRCSSFWFVANTNLIEKCSESAMQASQTIRQQFVELVKAHQGILHRISSVYARNIEDRHDLFQEMVLQLWRSYPSFRGRSSFTTWMYRVARNTYAEATGRPRGRFHRGWNRFHQEEYLHQSHHHL